MEDRHTQADDGWETGTGRSLHRIVGSNSWPQCAFYGCFDGHGGSRTATAAARILWSELQGRLVKYCRAAGGSSESAASVGGGADAPVGEEDRLPTSNGRPVDPPSAAELGELLTECFAFTEADVLLQGKRGRWADGCTAVTALLFGPHLVVGNLGDSRIVLCSGGKAVRLSEDHKPSNPKELARIHKAGGFVRSVMGIARLNGDLSLSRAFGDAEYKRAPPPKSPPPKSANPLRSQSPVKNASPAKAATAKGFARATAGSAGRGREAPAGSSDDNAVDAPAAADASGKGVSGKSWAAVAAPPVEAPAEREGPLSAIPDIFSRTIDANNDKFLLLACDGVWDVFSDEVAVKHVATALASSRNDPRKAADHLVDQVLRSGRCTDNVTALVVLLQAT